MARGVALVTLGVLMGASVPRGPEPVVYSGPPPPTWVSVAPTPDPCPGKITVCHVEAGRATQHCLNAVGMHARHRWDRRVACR